MPRVRVPIRRSGVRVTARPGRQYPVRPASNRGLAGLIGGLAGLLLCLLCLATLGLLGLFATFIAVTAYLGNVYRALKNNNNSASGQYMNMAFLLVALGFVGYQKLRRSL
jgi:predicted lipid-binding transport protein (Tim44 family)